MNELLINKTTAFYSVLLKIVLSPGRINIGEHIDYNDGYVLPAIDKIICLLSRKK
jgi:galactokinase